MTTFEVGMITIQIITFLTILYVYFDINKELNTIKKSLSKETRANTIARIASGSGRTAAVKCIVCGKEHCICKNHK